jgi:hypothetical protein
MSNHLITGLVIEWSDHRPFDFRPKIEPCLKTQPFNFLSHFGSFSSKLSVSEAKSSKIGHTKIALAEKISKLLIFFCFVWL